MKYVAWAFHQNQILGDELSENEFARALMDRKLILQNIEAEETFRALLDNYAELESALLSIGQDYTLIGHLGHIRAMSHRLLLDRRYANFLSTCRLYINFADSAVKNQGGSQEFEHQTHREYDRSLGYRVMEALRNYVQHRGFPLERITYTERAAGNVQDGIGEIRIIPGLAINRLRTDDKFKKKVFHEIESLTAPPDLRPWTREYVDGLRRCHGVLITQMSSGLDDAISRYAKATQRFADRIPIEGLIVRYEKRDEDNRVLEELAFTDELIELLKMLKSDNKIRRDIAGTFVSNDSRKPLGSQNDPS